MKLTYIFILALLLLSVSSVSAYSPPKSQIVMIASNWPMIVQGHLYAFQLRTLDSSLITKTTPYDEFWGSQGYLSNVTIKATLYNYDGTILHVFNGTTNEFGFYEGSILMENEKTNEVYTITFDSSYPHMVNDSKTFSFELVDHRDTGENN